jgi:glutamate-ammonia-ligase adenylyltransferase
VLVHAHSMPALLANTGTIALLKLASEQGLIPADLADQVRTAYRHFRRLQHAARLNEEQRIEVTAELAADYRNARALWQVIFPD